MPLLVPTWLDLAGWAGTAFASLALIGLGRLLSSGRAAPEAALIAGWGGAALLLTLWGVATPASLRIPAIAIALAGASGLALPRFRLAPAEWLSLGRILGLAVPLLAVMASARPSEPDTFLNLLPNAAYLYDHASFPGDLRPAAHSFLPAAPYNLQFFAFLASLVTPGFPADALIGANLVLLLAAGLLLARLAAQGNDDPGLAPSWAMTALGLLLATALNPGFVPRYHLSGYGEGPVAVTVAFAGWFAADALSRRGAGTSWWLMALSLAALVEIKQQSVALVAALLVAAFWAAGADREGRRPWRALALAALPAVMLFAAWRWYVLRHAAAAELQLLPLGRWQVASLPTILWHMGVAVAQKPLYYVSLAAAAGAGAWRRRRRGADAGTRAAAILAACFVLYSGALLLAYVAAMAGTMGIDAHSFFRYGTHLALLLMVAAVPLARAETVERGWTMPHWGRGALVVLMLAAPVIFLGYLRFDIEPPELRVWQLARSAAQQLDSRDRVALVLPGDNGSVAAMLETVLRDVAPRRPDLELRVVADAAPRTLDALAAEGYRLALVSCVPADLKVAPAGTAALLEHQGTEWRARAVWRYPPAPTHGRWAHTLSRAPLCL